MIVQRVSYYPKLGCMGKLVRLTRAEMQRFPAPHAGRLYGIDLGCSAPVAMELEFENYDEREKFWAAWFADPGSGAYIEKAKELVGRMWAAEMWALKE